MDLGLKGKSSLRPGLGWAFLRSVPRRASAPLLGAVFFTFSSLGFIIDISDLGAHPAAWLAVEAMGWGLVGSGYAFAAIWSRKVLPLVVVAHVLLTMQTERFAEPTASTLSAPAAVRGLQIRLTVDAIGCAAGLTLGYSLFMLFIRREGARYLAGRAEIALAKTIHETLVPPLDTQAPGFEFYGASVPSGEVGGDLLDVVQDGAHWVVLVADVSGHGVPAGLVMGMVKSAARMRLRSPAGVDALFNDLNRVLFGLKTPNMFITCASLRGVDPEHVEFGLAGHLPILHLKRSTRVVDELSVGQVPLGVLEEVAFEHAGAHVAPGDLLVLVTDGLTEVADGRGEEFGLDRLKKVVVEHADAPLRRVFDAVMHSVRAHGPQLDDQTLLLVRCTGGAKAGPAAGSRPSR